jgi:hypothetical protein
MSLPFNDIVSVYGGRSFFSSDQLKHWISKKYKSNGAPSVSILVPVEIVKSKLSFEGHFHRNIPFLSSESPDSHKIAEQFEKNKGRVRRFVLNHFKYRYPVYFGRPMFDMFDAEILPEKNTSRALKK